MNPKEKALELLSKYTSMQLNLFFLNNLVDGLRISLAKKCALIAVDEILENVYYFINHLELDGLPNNFGDEIEYWIEVKNELEKL